MYRPATHASVWPCCGLTGGGLGPGGGGGALALLAVNSHVPSFIVSSLEPTSTHFGVVWPLGTGIESGAMEP